MNVLSLFDGMSCGQLALDRLGIPINNYYASEISKYAIQITQANFPNTIQLGDVRDVDPLQLPKIDLVLGGSPCQGFSNSGLQLGMEDPRSQLFWQYIRILREVRLLNPDVNYLLENVKMKPAFLDIINEAMGHEPIEINSALVSAQSRKRLYWTNILVDGQPADKGIVLRDIVESGYCDRDKSHCLDACYYKGGNLKTYIVKSRRQIVYHDLGCIEAGRDESIAGFDMLKRIYDLDGKCPTLTAATGGNQEKKIAVNATHYRKLLPVECERLQTVPDGYTAHVSNTRRYEALGNGWTIDVICHILRGWR